jgi:hypothetical protein
LSAVLNDTDAVGGRHAVHFINFRILVSIPGSVEKPIVPPLIWTDAAVTTTACVAVDTSITPPRVSSHDIRAVAGDAILIAVNILKFFVAPICAPVGVSLVQKYPT